ncbi:MAG: hypothetical protein HRT47_01935 [Candidatus Caenarcaniphilales bacterium]|nr:hypothetical protein [Candidatus Caenarcaniphilales bacterium]
MYEDKNKRQLVRLLSVNSLQNEFSEKYNISKENISEWIEQLKDYGVCKEISSREWLLMQMIKKRHEIKHGSRKVVPLVEGTALAGLLRENALLVNPPWLGYRYLKNKDTWLLSLAQFLEKNFLVKPSKHLSKGLSDISSKLSKE